MVRRRLNTSIVLTILAAAVGTMAILGLIGVLVNRFRKQRRQESKKQPRRTKSTSPKRKKYNHEAERRIYTINDDTYSMGTFEGLGTFRTEPFPSISEHPPANDGQSMGLGPYASTALEHSFIQSDDFEDVWSFIATDIDESTLPHDEENITLEGDGSFIQDSRQTPEPLVIPKYFGRSDRGSDMFEV